MQVGDQFGNLEVIHITYRKRRDGSQGAPVFVDVRCKCGVEKEIRASVLTGKYPQQSCGGKGCQKRGPARSKTPDVVDDRPPREEWVCQRRGSVDGLVIE